MHFAILSSLVTILSFVASISAAPVSVGSSLSGDSKTFEKKQNDGKIPSLLMPSQAGESQVGLQNVHTGTAGTHGFSDVVV
ncbi:hypothetical protein QCA50_016063 [Cerrena zonata]|uniref:Uncharacterized protein n=1 Tax=Cerrena zonata TaxID=2478898 RepID=A0AAW0FVL9_9APHY